MFFFEFLAILLIFDGKMCIMEIEKSERGVFVNFQNYFPIWSKLDATHQERLQSAVALKTIEKGTVLHNASMECTALFLVKSGQLRAYMFSDEGREVTLYRLFDRDMCLFSASCLMRSIQFEITIEAEKDTELWVIPVRVYQEIKEESAPLANYTNEIMATRFTDVMWLIEQVMWKSFDKRLARFLIDEAILEQTANLQITHEKIASHLGTAREVVTRMLKYFQSEGMVRLTRGAIEIIDENKLEELTDS